MDLDFRKDQQMIKKTAREFLDKECPRNPFVREMEKDQKGYSQKLWKKMADLGWLGLIFPEKYGGMEGDFLDLVILLEEMGRACLPGPFLSSMLVGTAILSSGSEKQKKVFLKKISDGGLICSLAMNEIDGKYKNESIRTIGKIENGNIVVSGVKMFVPDAHVSNYILFPVRVGDIPETNSGITLLLLDPLSEGVKIIDLEDTIARDKLFRLEIDNVKIPIQNVIGKLGKGWPILKKLSDYGAVGECAKMVGGSRQVLELSVNYAKRRQQYGHVIGSFQIIQHYLSNMLSDVDASSLMTYQAAWKLANGLECSKDVSMAKAFVNDAYYRVCIMGHQIHGGVGFTEEFDLGLYFRRAKSQELSFGDTDYHVDVVASEMGLN